MYFAQTWPSKVSCAHIQPEASKKYGLTWTGPRPLFDYIITRLLLLGHHPKYSSYFLPPSRRLWKKFYLLLLQYSWHPLRVSFSLLHTPYMSDCRTTLPSSYSEDVVSSFPPHCIHRILLEALLELLWNQNLSSSHTLVRPFAATTHLAS